MACRLILLVIIAVCTFFWLLIILYEPLPNLNRVVKASISEWTKQSGVSSTVLSQFNSTVVRTTVQVTPPPSSSPTVDYTSITATDSDFSTTFRIESPAHKCGHLVRSPWPGYSRLGNHMFVYASFYGMAKRQERMGANKTFFWAVHEYPTYLDDIFENLTMPQKALDENWIDQLKFQTIKESACCRYDGKGLDDLACDGRNIYIKGYRSSWKYFAEVQDEIRREFEFKKSVREKCEAVVRDAFEARNLTRDNCVAVGVHLRRGDMVPENPNDTTFYYVPAKVEYLKKLIRFHEALISVTDEEKMARGEKVDCLAFLIFGDDPDWNGEAASQVQLIRSEGTHLIVFGKENKPHIDLCAMSSCNHMALSVGSFGWWAGFFNRGIVTYQKEYAAALKSSFEPKEYFLPHWIPL